jgi:predicted Zn-dependent protease
MPPAALQNRYVQQWLSQFPEVKNPSARYLQFTRSLSVAPQQKNVTTVNDVIRKTGDYCDEMVAGTAQRWSADRFPLRVYIEPSGGAGFRPSCPNLVEQALSQWTAVSGYRLTFTRSNDAANADIVVSWMPCATATECGNTSTRYVPDRAGNRLITSALVQISTWEQGPISDGELKKICLHELGHALGLKHSSNPLDIMFWQSNRNQICNLGPRDGNTIRRFYGLD